MHIIVRRFSSALLRDRVAYLVSVDKPDGRNNEYVVDIARLHRMMYGVFAEEWSLDYLRNCCWMVSFYTLDALFCLTPGSRFQADNRMAFTRQELERFLVEGIGGAIAAFLREQSAASLVAVAVRQALGRVYARLLTQQAAKQGFRFNQTWVQEAVYVIEKKSKNSGFAPGERSPLPGRRRRCREGDYAI